MNIQVKKTITQRVDSLFEKNHQLKSIIETFIKHNVQAFLVGGAVRDMVMDKDVKDVDIEVHGISVNEVEEILRMFGPLHDVGKSFGVFRIAGLNIDWSLPRRDSKGRKPKVFFDLSMSFTEAASRRDFTMNALGIDLCAYLQGVLENFLLDPFGGIEDIKHKILRAVNDDTFNDDPLRFYRVMHFIARFEMTAHDTLNEVCKKSYLQELARERIFEEYKKMFLLSARPSLGIRWLCSVGRIPECLPEVARLMGVVQNPNYHPEGDVFEHTMQALDASADLQYRNEDEKLMIMFAALCHDLGKADCTKPDGTSYGHSQAGVPLAYNLIKRFTSQNSLLHAVMKLVEYHLMPGQLASQKSSSRAYKRLAIKLAPNVSLYHLSLLATCDMRGRNGASQEPLKNDFEEIAQFLDKATQAQVVHEKEKPLLLGRDFIHHVDASPEIGALVKRAYELQIQETISDRDELWKRVMSERDQNRNPKTGEKK